MSGKRRLRRPQEVRAVAKKLRRLHRRPVPPDPNYASIRRQTAKRIKEGVRAGMVEDLSTEVERYIDTYIEPMKAEVRARHRADLVELGELLLTAEPLIDGYQEMAADAERTLDECRYAVHAAIEDLQDSDAPKVVQFRERHARALQSDATAPSVSDDALPNASRVGPIAQLVGTSGTRVHYWPVLGAAAAVDAATFHPVVAVALPLENEPVVWTIVAGFTIVALALAHGAGVAASDKGERHFPAITSARAWMALGAWLSLGLAAFLIRYIAPGSDTYVFGFDASAAVAGAGQTTTLLAAVLFITLYIATGTVAGLAGHSRPHPAIKAYRKAKRAESRAALQVAHARHALASAKALTVEITALRLRREEDLADALARCSSAAQRLKVEASIGIQAARSGRKAVPDRLK